MTVGTTKKTRKKKTAPDTVAAAAPAAEADAPMTATQRPEDLPEPQEADVPAEAALADVADIESVVMSATEVLAIGEALSFEVFISRKSQLDGDHGFDPEWVPDYLFDFQRFLLGWSLRKGRSAVLANCGLGKSPIELVWAQNVLRRTNKPVLILTPLMVAPQFVTEGEKFQVEVHRAKDGISKRGVVNVLNYEQLHKLNPDDFGGVVCDESSVIKHGESVTRAAVTEFMRTVPYRLLCTATAAPNDLPELGTSSEALGYLGLIDMLGRFFKNDRNTIDTKGRWRGHGAPRTYQGPQFAFRGHAEEPFWKWVCSWARSLRKPSDFGFEDGKFILPPLIEREHLVSSATPPPGMLFALPARGLREERAERRRTLRERCEKAASLVADTGQPAVAWCHLNDEGDLLESLIPGAIQVSGKDSDDAKEEKLRAFVSGQARVLATKPVLAAWGLNWQHCNHMTSFATHSFEQDYQSVRRCYRFGQERPVTVDRVLSDGEVDVMKNLRRKAEQADMLFDKIVRYMLDAMHIERGRTFTKTQEVPSWL